VIARPFGAGGRAVPVIGQGTWEIASGGAAAAKSALRAGIELGLVHIDTAELYGDAEEIVGEAIRGLPRESLFIVSKVVPSHASYEGTLRACEGSLRRLGLDYLDGYLLHWPSSYPVAETMRALERLVDDGKIRALGVSNFDVAAVDGALAALARHPLACNQVLYNLGERGIERNLLPHCAARGIAVVGYSPFGQGNFPAPRSGPGRALAAVAARRETTTRAVALAFLTRLDGTFAIPKSAREAHVRENASAAEVELAAEDVAEIDAAFPAPPGNPPLATL
jgi:diketogulonate reductase-like aldo/keto reductase